jgi:cytochrome P450
LRRRYGEIATLKTATAPLVIALTSEGARQVLTANPEGYNAFHKEPFTGLTGVGSLWVIDGLRHRRERQLLSPRFSAHRIRSYGEVIKQVTLLHTDRWQTRQAIRAYEVMLDISRDIIFRVMFGVERGNLMDEGRRTLKRLLRCVHPLLSVHHAFQAWWFPPWIRYWRAKQEFAGTNRTTCWGPCSRRATTMELA